MKYIIALLMIPSICFSQTFKGSHIDYLALAMESKKRVKEISDVLRPGTFIGVLDYTFGNVDPNLDYLLSLGKIGAFRKHCFNGSGKRNGRLQPYEPRVTDLKELGKCSREAQVLVQKYPSIGCFVSPVLEHDEKSVALVESWKKVIKENAPSCEVVISPYTGYVGKADTEERHGNKAKADVTSNDGESLWDANTGNKPVVGFPNYLDSGKKIVFGWWHELNWNSTGGKVWIPPMKRKASPDIWQFQMAQKILEREEVSPIKVPSSCKKVRSLKERELWKIAAEDYNNGDTRGNKPLFISKINKKMSLISQSGKVVGCLNCPLSGGCRYSGDKGYYRYYAGSCSGTTGLDLLNKAGSEWIYIQNGNECILTNAIRRKGYYRNGG